MSNDAVQFRLEGKVAVIRLDDGKRNALPPEVLKAIYEALDEAEKAGATVIITGRESVFSAGFDLNVMKRGGANALKMLRLGYALTARVLSYPYPVIAACNGHSFAMGVFLMLSADYVIGTYGDYKIAANEVAIGMTMPRVAAAMLKHRLRPSAYQRAVTVAHHFDVESAYHAGFFDELVHDNELMLRAKALAEQFEDLDRWAHRRSKRRIRSALVRRIRWSIPLDLWDAVMTGIRWSKKRNKQSEA